MAGKAASVNVSRLLTKLGVSSPRGSRHGGAAPGLVP